MCNNRLAPLAVIATLSSAAVAHAQSSAVLIVESADLHPTIEAVVVQGTNFMASGTIPRIYLNGIDKPLKITSLTDRSLTAILPAGLPSARYVVRLWLGDAPGQSDEKPLHVGVIGPEVDDR